MGRQQVKTGVVGQAGLDLQPSPHNPKVGQVAVVRARLRIRGPEVDEVGLGDAGGNLVHGSHVGICHREPLAEPFKGTPRLAEGIGGQGALVASVSVLLAGLGCEDQNTLVLGECVGQRYAGALRCLSRLPVFLDAPLGRLVLLEQPLLLVALGL